MKLGVDGIFPFGMSLDSCGLFGVMDRVRKIVLLLSWAGRTDKANLLLTKGRVFLANRNC